MNLLTQEQGAQLRPGDLVHVCWFSPRKPKGDEPPSRQWDGRQEWLESVWRDQVVATAPVQTVSDGLAVTLEGRGQLYCVSRMEKVELAAEAV